MTRVVLLSGGLDSAVCLAMEPKRSVAVYVHYGQPAAAAERAAARDLASTYRARLYELRADLGVGRYIHAPGDPLMVVAGRNAMLLSLAGVVARHYPAPALVIGANAADHDEYVDCRKPFLGLMAQALDMPVHAPLLEMRKDEVGNLANDLEMPTDLTWSCYYPTPAGDACGRCNACVGRKDALA